MMLRGRHGSTEYEIALRDASLTVGVGQEKVIACDRGGRLYSLFRGRRMHRRGLNGRMIRKWHDGTGRHRVWIEPREAGELVDDAARTLARLLGALTAPGWTWERPPSEAEHASLLSLVERGAAFDRAAADADARRFAAVYEPIGILPPDHYLSLVLQATEGCSFGTCAFCNLYQRPFRVRSVEEFQGHLAAVRDYFGESLSLRRLAIFLEAANALAAPMGRLVPLLREMERQIGRPPRGIHAFVDGFTGSRKTVEDYRTLAELGLKRVYIGLESGHDPLLEFVRKPARSAEVVDTVARLKAAGVNVAVIVMVGLGGDRFAAGHVADSIQAVNAMRLGEGDLIFFSQLIAEPDTAYPHLADRHGITPMSPAETEAQQDLIQRGLAFPGPPPRTANYDIREFVY